MILVSGIFHSSPHSSSFTLETRLHQRRDQFEEIRKKSIRFQWNRDHLHHEMERLEHRLETTMTDVSTERASSSSLFSSLFSA